jgi:hypothetical protein
MMFPHALRIAPFFTACIALSASIGAPEGSAYDELPARRVRLAECTQWSGGGRGEGEARVVLDAFTRGTPDRGTFIDPTGGGWRYLDAERELKELRLLGILNGFGRVGLGEKPDVQVSFKSSIPAEADVDSRKDVHVQLKLHKHQGHKDLGKIHFFTGRAPGPGYKTEFLKWLILDFTDGAVTVIADKMFVLTGCRFNTELTQATLAHRQAILKHDPGSLY